MSFGWLHDGKDFIRPASDKEAEEFKRTGRVMYQSYMCLGAKPIYLQIVQRENPRAACKKGAPTNSWKDWAREVFGGANPSDSTPKQSSSKSVSSSKEKRKKSR